MNRDRLNLSAVRELRFPPIAEAVVGVDFSELVELDDLKVFTDKVSASFESTSEIKVSRLEAKFVPDAEGFEAGEVQPFETVGYRSTGHRDGVIMMVWRGKMICARQYEPPAKPYTGWDAFFAPCIELIDLAVQELRWSRLARVGLRYINRFTTPPLGDLLSEGGEVSQSDLRTYFKIGEDTARHTTAFNAAAEVDFGSDERFGGVSYAATVREVWTTDPDQHTGTCLLDTDAYCRLDSDYSRAVVVDLLDECKNIKNHIFFNSFSPGVLDRFNYGEEE